MTKAQVKLSEFSDLITRYTADFVGRGWLVDQANALLDDPGCRFVVLTGGPGVGKTAFMAHLAATHPGWLRYFIRRDSRDLLRPGDANTFLLTIGGQLATLYPHLFHPENLEVIVRQRIEDVEAGGEAVGARVEELRASPFYHVALRVEQEIRRVAGKVAALEIGRLVSEPRLLQMQDLQYLGLLDPARLLAQKDPEARIVVLVDALDELRYSPAEPDILRALRELPEMPPNLCFVMSSRPEAFLGRLLARADARELPLDVAGAANQADLQAYTEGALAVDGLEPALPEGGLSSEAFVEGLLAKAAGNFLYLKSVLSGLQEALEDPAKHDQLRHLLHVEELPDDLGALYGHFLAFTFEWVKEEFGETAWRDYLRPFLGILAVAQEPLSEEQITAFTGVKREDIRDLHRELRQFIEVFGDERLIYRIYHASFAEYLLDSEHNRDYWIDGQERHGCIADHYLDTWGGMEAGLPGLQEPDRRDLLDEVYGLRHLAAHLERAERGTKLHQLLALESNRQRNSWCEAKELIGDTTGFMTDVARAWRLAEEVCACEDEAEIRSRAISLQCRYALISASVNSLAQNIPSALLVALVGKRIWTPTQGLAYARQVPNYPQRVEALKGLVSFFPDAERVPVLQEALLAVRAIGNDHAQVKALTGLIPFLSKPLLPEALELVREIRSKDDRAQMLVGLALHLPEPLRGEVLREALAIARAMGWNDSDRACILAELTLHLPEPLRDEVLLARDEALAKALVTVRTTEMEDNERARALTQLASHLPEPLLREALAAAQEIRSDYARAQALTGLASRSSEPMRSEMLSKALAAAWEVKHDYDWMKALIGLAPHLPEPLLRQALMAVQDSKDKAAFQVFALAGLISQLAELGFPEEALAAVRAIKNEWHQALVLIELAPRLPELMRDQVLNEALRAALALTVEDHRVQALAWLAPHLPEPLLREALTAQVIGDADIQVQTMAGLAPHLPEPMRGEVLTKALTMVGEIKESVVQAKVLVGLAPHLPEPLLDEALVVAQTIGWAEGQAEVLVELAQYLPRHLKDEALQMHGAALRKALVQAREIEWNWARAQVLTTLALHWPEPLRGKALREALAAARMIGDADHRARALAELAPQLPKPLRGETWCNALAAAREIKSDHDRVRVLVELVPLLAELGLPREALVMERGIAIADDSFRHKSVMERFVLKVLDTVVFNLPKNLLESEWYERVVTWKAFKNLQADVLSNLHPDLLESLLTEALAAAREIGDKWRRVEAQTKLATRLAESGYPEEALVVAQAIEPEDDLDKALSVLAPYLPEPLVHKALRVARAIGEGWRSKALTKLTIRLAELGDPEEALRTARIWTDDNDRAKALAGIAQHLSEPLQTKVLSDALAAAQRIRWSEQARAEALVELAPHLPEPLRDEALQDALAAAKGIGSNYTRAEVLVEMAPHLPKFLRNEVLSDALTAMGAIEWSNQTRSEMLAELALHLTEPVRSEALRLALASARKIEWDEARAEALAELVPHLPEPVRDEALQDALAAVMTIERDKERVQVLTRLAPHLIRHPDSIVLYRLWCKILHASAFRTRKVLLCDLLALAPVIAALGGQEAVAEMVRAIQDVGRWWP